ncbi:MAG: heavy-metal-associated domain-containing protein [Armatimonadota bacterium]
MFHRCMGVLAALLVAANGLALAAVEKVSVRVDGLACPFCAYNIEKRVRKLDGLDRSTRIETIVAKGMVHFRWKASRPFDPMLVRKAIHEAGFTARTMELTASGTVQIPKGTAQAALLRLVDEGAQQAILLRPADGADYRKAWDGLKAQAQATSDGGAAQRIRVEGQVQVGKKGERDAPWSLILHRWTRLSSGPSR